MLRGSRKKRRESGEEKTHPAVKASPAAACPPDDRHFKAWAASGAGRRRARHRVRAAAARMRDGGVDRRERDACVQVCVTLFFLSPFFRPLPLPCSAKPLAAWRPPCPAGRPATCRPRLGRLAGRRPSGRCVNEMTEREGSKSACSTTAAEVRWASRPPLALHSRPFCRLGQTAHPFKA